MAALRKAFLIALRSGLLVWAGLADAALTSEVLPELHPANDRGAAELETSAVPASLKGQQMDEYELAQVTGRALFVSDVIQGQAAHGIANDFTFYRIGMDADLYLNLNIDKLQLGCGGFNEGLVLNACDLDLDFMSLTGSGPDDDFLLQQPYLELAIKNDGDRTRREVAGIKIGSAAAEGLMSVGRRYPNGQINREHGLENGNACGGSNATQDDGTRLACSSGVNRISGFLLGEFSAQGEIGDWTGADVCMGWTTDTSDNCNQTHEMFAAFSGTRIDRIGLVGSNGELRTDSCGFALAILGCPDANFKMSQSLRALHSVPLTASGSGPRQTRDFFLSFQRERIAYPIFDQSNPYGTTGPNQNPDQTPANGGTWNTSAWSAPTNTGWWMNITYADVRDLQVGTMNLGGVGDAIDALLNGGALQDLNLRLTPVDNCFGSAQFC